MLVEQDPESRVACETLVGVTAWFLRVDHYEREAELRRDRSPSDLRHRLRERRRCFPRGQRCYFKHPTQSADIAQGLMLRVLKARTPRQCW